MITGAEYVDGMEEMVVKRIAWGFKPYLLTFMFNPIGGSEDSKKERMMDEVSRFYSRLLNYTFRHPYKEPTNSKPLWLYSHDWPVPKGSKLKQFNWDHLFNITLNDGLHGHAFVLHPPITCMKQGLLMHIEENQQKIHGPQHPFQRVHGVEVTHEPEYVLGYALKSIVRRRTTEVLVLPQSSSELTKYCPYDRELHVLAAQDRQVARLKARATYERRQRI